MMLKMCLIYVVKFNFITFLDYFQKVFDGNLCLPDNCPERSSADWSAVGRDHSATTVWVGKNNMAAFGWSWGKTEFDKSPFQIFWFDLWQFWHLGGLKWFVNRNLSCRYHVEFWSVDRDRNFISN